MSRSTNSTGRRPWGCIVFAAVLLLFGVFQCSTPDDINGSPPPEPASRSDEPSSEPASDPATTVVPVTPPDIPESPDVPETPDIPETPDAPEEREEKEEEGADETGNQDSDVQMGIQFGSACSPVGALGIANDGRPAKCFMGRDGQARWGYDSNRG